MFGVQVRRRARSGDVQGSCVKRYCGGTGRRSGRRTGSRYDVARRLLVAVCVVGGSLACGPAGPGDVGASTKGSSAAAPMPRSQGEAPLPTAVPGLDPLRLPAGDRLIAVGDLHGDLAATRAALRLGGVIDDGDR